MLILTGDVELGHQLPVTREGFVVIPQVGQIYVANLSLDQLRDLLYTRLGRVYSGVKRGAGATTQFQVSVAKVRTNQVFVMGEVARPGAYSVSALGTVMNALYAAGGPTEHGDFREVRVMRAGRLVGTLDLYDYLLAILRLLRSGDATQRISADAVRRRHAGTDVKLMGCKSPDPNRPFGDLAGGRVCGANRRPK